MGVRTRFAPSPTGRLHLGNVRAAAFNWLFARHHGGDFVLRVEDTDRERNVPGAEEALMEDLRWLGLHWDEGPDIGGPRGPYRQSERSRIYRDAADELVARGRAYPCYCTDAELEADVVETPGGAVVRYPGRCRGLTAEERRAREAEVRPRAIRFALPEGLDIVEIEDEVRGPIVFPANDLDDFVLLRRDGRPTYNFAVVVDDAGMAITHVIRGAGHLSNTPRQVLLFDALGWERPSFAHLPTVLAPGGGRLSKRTGAASLDELREAGYHPAAVVNYVSLLGWSSPDEREVLSRGELVERIGLERVGASDTAYDPDKLRWMSGRHIQAMESQELVEALGPFIDLERFPLTDKGLPAAVEALRSRLSAFGDVDEHLATFFFPPDTDELRETRRGLAEDPGAAAVLRAVAAALRSLPGWEAEALGRAVRDAGRAVEARGAALFHPVREALTGAASGPDLGLVMEGLGRREVLERLDRVLDREGTPPEEG